MYSYTTFLCLDNKKSLGPSVYLQGTPSLLFVLLAPCSLVRSFPRSLFPAHLLQGNRFKLSPIGLVVFCWVGPNSTTSYCFCSFWNCPGWHWANICTNRERCRLEFHRYWSPIHHWRIYQCNPHTFRPEFAPHVPIVAVSLGTPFHQSPFFL